MHGGRLADVRLQCRSESSRREGRQPGGAQQRHGGALPHVGLWPGRGGTMYMNSGLLGPKCLAWTGEARGNASVGCAEMGAGPAVRSTLGPERAGGAEPGEEEGGPWREMASGQQGVHGPLHAPRQLIGGLLHLSDEEV